MKCAYCRRPNSRENEFCIGCGAPMIENNDLADLYFKPTATWEVSTLVSDSVSINDSVSLPQPEKTIHDEVRDNIIATGFFEATQRTIEYTFPERILKFMGLID